MYLSRLALTDFRCYTSVDLRLEPGVTAFTGANGQGKTNLLEAVGYLATLASHRVATDAPLVRGGAQQAIVRAEVTSDERSLLVEIEINPARANRARLNRAPRRPREILGALRAVLFAPEDLALVKGDPGERRRYLDELLIQSAPRYAGVRSDYDRVVRQRTALLKSARGRQPMLGALEAWDDQLIRTGAELMSGRLELIGALRPLIVKSYAGVAGDDSAVEVSYRPAHLKRIQPDLGEPTADTGLLAASMREALAGYRAAEIDRGVCLVGPHRDELDLRLDSRPARGYASHGESWSLALALRLAGYELLRSAGGGGGDPVLLLDDVFAELDGQRRDRLATVAAATEQVIVTAAVPADLPAGLRAARFSVSDGVISRA